MFASSHVFFSSRCCSRSGVGRKKPHKNNCSWWLTYVFPTLGVLCEQKISYAHVSFGWICGPTTNTAAEYNIILKDFDLLQTFKIKTVTDNYYTDCPAGELAKPACRIIDHWMLT
eukprot:scaffold7453_cov177-Amphora_coffeaeformis.AAC.7